MTAIVAVRADGLLIMGADRCVTDSSTRVACDESKILQRTTRCGVPLLIGVCGEVSYCQRWNSMPLPKLKSAETGYDYVVRLVASPQGRRLIPRTVTLKDGSEELIGSEGMAIVAILGQNYEVDAAGGVVSFRHGEVCIGSGAPWAQGSLHSTRRYRHTASARVEEALDAAATFAVGVMRPFDIVSIASALPEPPVRRR